MRGHVVSMRRYWHAQEQIDRLASDASIDSLKFVAQNLRAGQCEPLVAAMTLDLASLETRSISNFRLA